MAPRPHATRGSGADRNPEFVSPRRPLAPRDVASTSGSSPAQAPQARAPNATSQHRWGGVYPKPTLLLSVRGCEWGSKPLSSDTYSTSQHGRMRMQVRLAAPGEHRGGFGTCGRRARGRTSPHQDPRPTPRAGIPRPGGGMRCTDSATPHVAGSCTRTSADPRPALPGPGRASAARTLPRPSDSDRVRLARERTTPLARTNGPQAILLVKILSSPRACHCQAPADTCAARTLPRPSDSDRARLARSKP
jgi:hypothetical protein